MSVCINPHCSQPNNPSNTSNLTCQSCHSNLLLNGRYRVTRLLSNNTGFGNIYEGFEPGRTVILKVLKPEHNNTPKAVELFQKEAVVLGALNHPGIPQIDNDGYFVHQTNNGLQLHCLIMEKIEGLNLQQWLEQRNNAPINQSQAIDWLRKITEVLAAVHSQQYFHRDIKPGNIMIRPNNELVLIDFGTAREGTYTYLAKLGMGHTITAIISEGYTPNEQKANQAVPQSDFFALGRTFVYLLTGKDPLYFYDANIDSLNWHSSTVNISPLLLNFIDKLMARLPGDRPRNTEEILQELELIKNQLNNSSSKKTTNKYMKHLSKMITAIVVLIVGGGLSKVMLDWLSRQPPTPIPTSSPTSITGPIPPPPPPPPPPPKMDCSQNPLYQLSPKKEILKPVDSNRQITALAISQGGQKLAIGDSQGEIKIWDANTGNVENTFTIPNPKKIANPTIQSLVFGYNGQTLISGDNDGQIREWNFQTPNSQPQSLDLQNKHNLSISSLAISQNGEFLVSGSNDKFIKVWDLNTKQLKYSIDAHTQAVNSVVINPDGKSFISAGNDGQVKIWDLQSKNPSDLINGNNSINSVAISSNGKVVAVNDDAGKISIFPIASGPSSGPTDTITKSNSSWQNLVAIDPSGQVLVSNYSDNSGSGIGRIIKTWCLTDDYKEHKEIDTLPNHAEAIASIVISPDGKTLVSASKDKIIVWQK